MAVKDLTLEDFMEFIDTLPYNDFRKVVERYSKNTGSDFKNDMEVITTLDFEKRITENWSKFLLSKVSFSAFQ